MDSIRSSFEKTFIRENRWKLIVAGIGNTLIITALSVIFGTILGFLLFMLCRNGNTAANSITNVCLWLLQGIPMVVLLMIFYFIIMVSFDGIKVGIVAFGINSGAYMAELVRSGLNAVNIGQMEAGRSLGLSKLQTMRKIILPQAIRYILPAIFNELIALLKETSVAGYVAVIDLTRAGTLVRNNTYNAVVPLTLVAVVYLVLVILLTRLLKLLERRLSNNDKRRKS